MATINKPDTSFVDMTNYLVNSGGSTLYYYVTATLGAQESSPSNTVSISHGVSIGDPKTALRFNDVPTYFSLTQNYPNPFNPTTFFTYSITEDSYVTIKVSDVLGREVAILVDEFKEANWYNAKFDAGNLPSGLYYYKINAGKFSQVKKMLLTR